MAHTQLATAKISSAIMGMRVFFRAWNLSPTAMVVRPSRLPQTPRIPSFELLDMLKRIMRRVEYYDSKEKCATKLTCTQGTQDGA